MAEEHGTFPLSTSSDGNRGDMLLDCCGGDGERLLDYAAAGLRSGNLTFPANWGILNKEKESAERG